MRGFGKHIKLLAVFFVSGQLVRLAMKCFYKTAVCGLAMAVAAGCTSEKKIEASMAHLGDETPPDFLTDAAMIPLQGYDGFSADVTETTATTNNVAKGAGELIGRRGNLIFQPWTTANIKKAKYVRGGMFFIWDTAAHSGYVLSEALQAYAPISSPAGVTNQTATTKELASEIIDGHPCHRGQIMLAFDDGSSVRLTEWRADDLQHFPIRIQVENAGRGITVNFSNVRLDVPPPNLFVPPTDFSKYANATALINELMIRESSFRSGPSGQLAVPIEMAAPPPGAQGGQRY
jgi:hypothetical protein